MILLMIIPFIGVIIGTLMVLDAIVEVKNPKSFIKGSVGLLILASIGLLSVFGHIAMNVKIKELKELIDERQQERGTEGNTGGTYVSCSWDFITQSENR